MIRTLLFRVLYLDPLLSETPISDTRKDGGRPGRLDPEDSRRRWS